MSEQFFYAEFKLLPKRGVVTASVSKAQDFSGFFGLRRGSLEWLEETPIQQ
jgi:hypothetical protein